ncbi:MAG: nicotinate-nucleotide adenylyltransferase [Syntrophomonadaceae bacterium]|nr:nicotinate-nucleotide adenylyltransferase [Syntrophomonadaceae bacterium]
MQKTGIMGGSFDPIHNGHLAIASAVRQALALDKVLFIPNPNPPHKNRDDMTDVLQRLHMVELAIGGRPDFVSTAIELERPGIIYSVDTVELLLRQEPEQDLYFIVGADSLQGLNTWKEPLRLLSMCWMAVVNRPGSEHCWPQGFSPELDECLKRRCLLVDIPPIDISSAAIRRRIKDRQPVEHMLPEPVLKYIEKEKLYAPMGEQ